MPLKPLQPLAIVTPWFGEHLKGGAEQQAYQLATRLAARGHVVHVLTTCARAPQDDWSENHFPAGETQGQGFRIIRFPLSHRNEQIFQQINHILLSIGKEHLKAGVNPITTEEARTFVEYNIQSPRLLKHLSRNKARYRAFIFIPYLYGPILSGLPLVADKALLQPCLHDEAYAYLPSVEALFRKARAILFNSAGEGRLGEKLFGPGILPRSHIVGEGVESLAMASQFSAEIKSLGPLELGRHPYLLYLGRRDITKNVPSMVRAFLAYKRRSPASMLRLALAGPGDGTDITDPSVVELGLVSEEEKNALLKHCLALVQPSLNESYSRVIMEAWYYEKPVLVNRKCLATAIAVVESGGGLLAAEPGEWEAQFAMLETLSTGQRDQLGRQGRNYANLYADWDKTLERFEKILERFF